MRSHYTIAARPGLIHEISKQSLWRRTAAAHSDICMIPRRKGASLLDRMPTARRDSSLTLRMTTSGAVMPIGGTLDTSDGNDAMRRLQSTTPAASSGEGSVRPSRAPAERKDSSAGCARFRMTGSGVVTPGGAGVQLRKRAKPSVARILSPQKTVMAAASERNGT